MSHHLAIGIDLDGVIIDHRKNKFDLAAHYGVTLEAWQANSNVMRRFIPPEHYDAMQQKLYGNITLDAPEVAGALDRLRTIADRAYIVSARRNDTIRSAQEWLSRHRVYDIIPAERIFFCNSDADKRGHCERLGISAFLDDKVKVLEFLPGVASRVLFDEDGIAERLEKREWLAVAKNWDEFLRMIGAQNKKTSAQVEGGR